MKRTAAMVSLAGLLAGCPGSLIEADYVDVSCLERTEYVFKERCTDAGCHSAIDPAEKLDLESPGISERVYDMDAYGCIGKLVNPASPQLSLVFLKLTDQSGCGSAMPLGQKNLRDEEILCVLEWIDAEIEARQ